VLNKLNTSFIPHVSSHNRKSFKPSIHPPLGDIRVLSTRDILKKRHLNKPEESIFCAEEESIQHLFLQCIVAKQIWQTISHLLDKKHVAFNSTR
jgi:hypothetical protein